MLEAMFKMTKKELTGSVGADLSNIFLLTCFLSIRISRSGVSRSGVSRSGD